MKIKNQNISGGNQQFAGTVKNGKSVEDLVLKYTYRLNTMNENIQGKFGKWTDDRYEGAEKRIKDTAEFIRDLKKLKTL